MPVSRTTDCSLQEVGEFAVSPEDTTRKYQTSLDECKTDCENSPQCRAMYYINRMCFIIYKDTQRIELLGSSYYVKVCHGIYCKYMHVFNKNILLVDLAYLYIFDSFLKNNFNFYESLFGKCCLILLFAPYYTCHTLRGLVSQHIIHRINML